MKATARLVDPEEEVVVDVDARDRRAFERLGALAVGLDRRVDMRTSIQANPETYASWLAWHAARRGGRAEPFDDWDNRLVEIALEVEEVDELSDPTSPAP